MEIIGVALIIASVVLPILAVLATVFFIGFFAYTLVAEREKKVVAPEPEPVTTAVAPQRIPVAA